MEAPEERLPTRSVLNRVRMFETTDGSRDPPEVNSSSSATHKSAHSLPRNVTHRAPRKYSYESPGRSHESSQGSLQNMDSFPGRKFDSSGRSVQKPLMKSPVYTPQGRPLVKDEDAAYYQYRARKVSSPGRSMKLPMKEAASSLPPVEKQHPPGRTIPQFDPFSSVHTDQAHPVFDPDWARPVTKNSSSTSSMIVKDLRQGRASPRLDPDGARPSSRRALSASPLRHIKKAPSPSRSRPVPEINSTVPNDDLKQKPIRSASVHRLHQAGSRRSEHDGVAADQAGSRNIGGDFTGRSRPVSEMKSTVTNKYQKQKPIRSASVPRQHQAGYQRGEQDGVATEQADNRNDGDDLTGRSRHVNENKSTVPKNDRKQKPIRSTSVPRQQAGSQRAEQDGVATEQADTRNDGDDLTGRKRNTTRRSREEMQPFSETLRSMSRNAKLGKLPERAQSSPRPSQRPSTAPKPISSTARKSAFTGAPLERAQSTENQRKSVAPLGAASRKSPFVGASSKRRESTQQTQDRSTAHLATPSPVRNRKSSEQSAEKMNTLATNTTPITANKASVVELNWQSSGESSRRRTQPTLPTARKASVVELSWPSERLEAAHLNKQDTTAYSALVEGKKRRAPRHVVNVNKGQNSRDELVQPVRPKAKIENRDLKSDTRRDLSLPMHTKSHENIELKRNLNAASFVMNEENGSSISSSSSSSRSTLSFDELGGIANQALKLSKIRTEADPKATRHEKSPILHMLTAKRTSKFPNGPIEDAPCKKESPQTTAPFSYGSAQRLSDRLTRAERFTALKKKKKANLQQDQGSVESIESPKKGTHPVFGYAQRKPAKVITTLQKDQAMDDSSADLSNDVSADHSSIRRSKHLSKMMQEKAVQHAERSSPTKRKQSGQGYSDLHQSKKILRSVEGRHYAEKDYAPSTSQQFRFDQVKQKSVTPEPYRERNFAPTEKQRLQQPEQGLPQKGKSSSKVKSKRTDDTASGSRKEPSQPLYDAASNKHLSRPVFGDSQRNPTVFGGEKTKKMPLSQEWLDYLAYEKRLQSGADPGPFVPRAAAQLKKDVPSLAIKAEGKPERIQSSHPFPHNSEHQHTRKKGGANNKDKDYRERAPNPELRSHKKTTRGVSAATLLLKKQPIVKEPESAIVSNQPTEISTLDLTGLISGPTKDVVMNPSLTSSGQEQIPDSLLMTDMSSEASAKLGGDSEPDETYTGSLNKHDIAYTVSSESSGTGPDAFQWLHKKYGTQPPTVLNRAILTKVTRASAPRLKTGADDSVFDKIKEDEDDDIFFGLEDEESAIKAKQKNNKPQQKQRKPLRKGAAALSRIKTERSPQGARTKKEKSPKPEKYASPDPLILRTKITESRPTEDQRQTFVQPAKLVPREFPAHQNMPHSGRTIDALRSEKSVTSDITSSLIVGGRTNYRFNPDDVIKEEPISDKVDPIVDEVSLQEKRSDPSASVLKNLGSAIVNSLEQACKLRENMNEYSTCAYEANTKCQEKCNEACLARRDDDEDDTVDDVEENKGYSTPVGAPRSTSINKNSLSDVEQRIRAAWDKRDRNPSEELPDSEQPEQHDNDRQTSDSSVSVNPERREKHREDRAEAQMKLHEHAEKAMQLHGTYTERGISTESSASAWQPKPADGGDVSVASRLSGALSFEQRAVLEQFSSSLKKEGVEVLKLGRRNRWQVRYLTVSTEVTRLDAADVAGDIGQCPQALLWPKQKKDQANSVSTIKENGRGGVQFQHLRQVRSTVSNEYYDKHLPKKLKKEFPKFAGVVLDYDHEGGERQLHFCFKTKIDAQAFITAMLIIKEAAERAVPKGRMVEASSTGSASESFDS